MMMSYDCGLVGVIGALLVGLVGGLDFLMDVLVWEAEGGR